MLQHVHYKYNHWNKDSLFISTQGTLPFSVMQVHDVYQESAKWI